MGGTIKQISLTVPKKGGKFHSVEKSGPFCFGMAFYLMLEALDALKMKYQVHMVKVGKCALMHKKWTFRVELTKKKLATVRVGIFFGNAE